MIMHHIGRYSKLAFPTLATLSATWLAATGCMEPPLESAAEPAAAADPAHTLVVSGPDGLTTIDLTAQKPVTYLATDSAVSAVSGDGRTNNNPDGSIPCYGPYIWNASGSFRAVAAEFGYANGDNGMLRARTTLDALGPWEKWDICIDDVVGTWSFLAHNSGRLVSAELDYVGGPHYAMLRARASLIGPWERFTVPRHDGFYTFRSYANGLYVSAEFGYQGYDNAVLRARASSAQQWETFHFTAPPN